MSDTQTPQPQTISQELLDILVCPLSKTKVILSEDGTKLLCTDECTDPKCPKQYPIENGIPKMLVED